MPPRGRSRPLTPPEAHDLRLSGRPADEETPEKTDRYGHRGGGGHGGRARGLGPDGRPGPRGDHHPAVQRDGQVALHEQLDGHHRYLDGVAARPDRHQHLLRPPARRTALLTGRHGLQRFRRQPDQRLHRLLPRRDARCQVRPGAQLLQRDRIPRLRRHPAVGLRHVRGPGDAGHHRTRLRDGAQPALHGGHLPAEEHHRYRGHHEHPRPAPRQQHRRRLRQDGQRHLRRHP